MIRSMTGFGHGEVSNDKNQKVTVEMKSVNHRYCDISLKLPKKLAMFEANIRNIMKEYASRGKIDIYVSYEDLSETAVSLHYNQAMAEEYMQVFKKMQEDFNIETKITAEALAKYPEVVTIEEVQQDEEVWWELLEAALRQAAEKFVETRTIEGANLKRDLLGKLDQMAADVAFIEERSPQIIAEYRSKLEEKVKEFLEDSTIEENRIAAEVTLYADKIAVDEEIVRLQSHISSMTDVLESDESIGRKLDFMAQEMNREANTILSKSSDVDLADHAIELKTNVEKVREQIQNIEEDKKGKIMEKRGSLLVISGFSGVGKGTVAKKLVEKYGYSLSISATTRQPREGEVDGREYFFKTVDDFKNLIDYNGFIEYARYVDNYYGTPRKFVEDELAAGHNVILEIEVQGAFNIKKQYEDALLIFITAPSAAAIKERLVGRGTESEEVINKRLNRAKEESEDMDKYDYIVINDQVEDCADRIHAIVQAKECLLGNNLKFIEATKKELEQL